MIEDEKIIEMFFERSEQGIRELDTKYGKLFHRLSYNIVNNEQDPRSASMTLIWVRGTPSRRHVQARCSPISARSSGTFR